MSRLLPGFRRIESAGAVLVVRDDLSEALVAAGFADPADLQAVAVRRYRGRGEAFGIDVAGAGAVFVRPYLHGGLLGKLTADLYGGDRRFATEVETLVAAREAGVPVPEALGYVSRPAGLGLRRGWLLTREIAGAQDLLACLTADPGPGRRARNAFLERAGTVLRTLHDAGFVHPDLHFKNLLHEPGGRLLVLDLDAARGVGQLDRDQRLAGLFRFDRYAAKQAAAGLPISRTDRLRVLRAYAGEDWPAREEVRELAANLARHIARHRVLRARPEGAAPPVAREATP